MKISTRLMLAATASLMALTAPTYAESVPITMPAKEGPQLGSFGVDTDGMDKTVAPADDFYLFANGKWAADTAIPADKSNYGMFTALDDLSKDRVKIVLEAERTRKGSKAGDVYASYIAPRPSRSSE